MSIDSETQEILGKIQAHLALRNPAVSQLNLNNPDDALIILSMGAQSGVVDEHGNLVLILPDENDHE